MSLPSYHILLIEDLDADVMLFQEYMRDSGMENYTIHHRYTLAEGRKVPREIPIDIIMLDLQLPDSLGFPTFEKIHAEFPGLPVIVMTGQSESSLGLRCVKAGAQDFLTKKNLNGDILQRSIGYAIERNILKNRLEEAQNLAMMGNWSVDMQSNDMLLSPQMYHIFGTKSVSDQSHNFGEYMNKVHKDDQELVAKHITESFETGREFEVDHRMVLENEEVKHVIMKARTKKDVDGKPLMLVGTTQDVTHRVQMQTLKKETELAIRSAKLRQEFLAKTSHEIRTPLNPILVLTDILLKGDLNPEQKKDLNTIKAAGNTLLAVVNDILDLSKIEAGKIDFVKHSFNLAKIFDYARDMLEPTAKKQNLKLVMDIDKEIPAFIVGDNVRLTQILLNLIGNAIKFTREGEITVSVKKKYEKEGLLGLEFVVADTGIGIPQDALKFIFESFQQIDSDTNRQQGGTGLGLTIVRQLVRLQGGNISAKSELGQGSTFTFELEFALEEVLEEKEEKIEILRDKLVGFELLLVEDNPLNQLVTQKLLSDWGIELQIANNGKEAIDLLAKRGFDLILMDVQMPEMDGYEATRHIREKMLKPFKDIPIIALTANAFSGSDDECLKAGMDDYVSKPIEITNLYSKIVQYVRKWPKEEVETELTVPVNQPEPEVIVHALSADETNLANGFAHKNSLAEIALVQNNGANKSFVEASEEKLNEEKTMSTNYVNLDYLRQISSNDQTIIRKAIEKFLDTTPELLAQMETQLQADDHQALSKSAHKLKSSVAFMGIEAIKDTLLKIENVAKTHQGTELLPQLVATTQNIINDSMEELKMKL